MHTCVAIGVSQQGLSQLHRRFSKVIEHWPGNDLLTLQHAVQGGATIVCPSDLAPLIKPHFVEVRSKQGEHLRFES